MGIMDASDDRARGDSEKCNDEGENGMAYTIESAILDPSRSFPASMISTGLTGRRRPR